jgi:RNA-directed DNA polymerase
MEANNLYVQICSMNNLANAWRRARKGKTKKLYIIEFEKNIRENLLRLQEELLNQTYKPESLKTFVLRDPKTRRISKSAFRDRIIHHALVRIIEPLFDKGFIYDSCANRKERGTLFALERFDLFKRKVTCNLRREAFCFKADIKHYFPELDREILIKIIQKKIKCLKTIQLIRLILNNFEGDKGMPLGNLTSQFFANVYLNELDYFVKHQLRAKFYIRYVDDFIILHKSKEQLGLWKGEIENFVRKELKLELHPDKSQITSLSRGVDFVGFRNFYYFKLLRKRNIRKARQKIKQFDKGDLIEEKLFESLAGWNAYAKWANSYNLRKEVFEIITKLLNK